MRKPSRTNVDNLSAGVKAVVDSMRQRVESELPTEDLGILFTSFDLMRWHAAKRDMDRNSDRSKLIALELHAKKMFRGWRLDASSGVRALISAAFKLCGIEEAHLRAEKPRDNRVVWAQVLAEGFLPPNDTADAFISMLQIYLAARDSTCDIERDLGALTRVLQQHRGNIDDDGLTVAAYTEILLDGPATESGIAVEVESAGNHLAPTSFAREVAALWMETRGRRFRVYSEGARSKPGPRGPTVGTWAAARLGVKRALDALVKAPRRGPDTPTILGVSRSSLSEPLPPHHPAKRALQKFDVLTKKKALTVKSLALARRGDNNPYKTPGFNPHEKLRRGGVLQGSRPPQLGVPALRRGSGGIFWVANCCEFAVPARNGYMVRDLISNRRPGLDFFEMSQIVVMDYPWQADGQADLCDRALAGLCGATALGKPVLGRGQWKNCLPDGPPIDALVQYRKVVTELDRTILLGSALQRECPLFCRILQACARVQGSKWRVQLQVGTTCGDNGSNKSSRVRSSCSSAVQVSGVPASGFPSSGKDGTLYFNSRASARHLLLGVRRMAVAARGLLHVDTRRQPMRDVATNARSILHSVHAMRETLPSSCA